MARPSVPLTVLIPVFNGERYVAKAIESILSQSFSDFELLILDDGSHDRTPQILQDYARRDSRIRLLRHENHGVAYTLDRGIREARGSLIAELGADDLALPERLKKQLAFLGENPDYVLVGGRLRIIDEYDREVGLRKYPESDADLRQCLLLYNPFGGPSLMYRRDAALAAGSYTSRFRTCEDYDLVLRLAACGRVANLAEPLISYRLHSGATKANRTLQSLRDTLNIKRVAVVEYGYHETIATRCVTLLQGLLTLMPGAFIYWLFQRVFIATADREA